MRMLTTKHRELVANGVAADNGRYGGQDVATAYRTRRDFIVSGADAELGGIRSDAEYEASVKRGDTLLTIGELISAPTPTKAR